MSVPQPPAPMMPEPPSTTAQNPAPPPGYPLSAMPSVIHEARRQVRRGTAAVRIYLLGAAGMHILAIPVSLAVFKLLVERGAGRALSWGELFDAVSRAGVLPFLVGSVLAQVSFAIIAGIAALYLVNGHRPFEITVIIVGVFALIFSIVVFGGVVGLIGGVLSVAGGVKAMARSAPGYSATPPPYFGPPPYRP